MSAKERAQKWIKSSLDDPIAKTLARNSHLTTTQLETLLIDVLCENMVGKSLKYDEKAKLRLSRVSRGSFNRTLRQARSNVIQTIYTIFLLGYLGILEDTRLTPYMEVGTKLRSYMKAYRGLGRGPTKEHLRIMNLLFKELKMSLEQFSRPRALSQNM